MCLTIPTLIQTTTELALLDLNIHTAVNHLKLRLNSLAQQQALLHKNASVLESYSKDYHPPPTQALKLVASTEPKRFQTSQQDMISPCLPAPILIGTAITQEQLSMLFVEIDVLHQLQDLTPREQTSHPKQEQTSHIKRRQQNSQVLPWHKKSSRLFAEIGVFASPTPDRLHQTPIHQAQASDTRIILHTPNAGFQPSRGFTSSTVCRSRPVSYIPDSASGCVHHPRRVHNLSTYFELHNHRDLTHPPQSGSSKLTLT